MPSDLQIPQPGYRQFRRSGGIDPATRRLAFIAAGVCGAVMLVVGGWMALGHHQHGVPLVMADTRPIRVKPENPGGMQVIGANDELQPGTGTGTGQDGVAPAPETPQLQALQQEIQAAKAAAVPPPVAASATPAPAPMAAAPAAVQPVAAQPGPAPAIAATQPVARGVARPGPQAGDTTVQVASLGSEAAAKVEWDRIGKRAPGLLDGRKPLIERADVGGHTVYRLRIGGFADIAAATEFCGHLRAKGGACSIADF